MESQQQKAVSHANLRYLRDDELSRERIQHLHAGGAKKVRRSKKKLEEITRINGCTLVHWEIRAPKQHIGNSRQRLVFNIMMPGMINAVIGQMVPMGCRERVVVSIFPPNKH